MNSHIFFFHFLDTKVLNKKPENVRPHSSNSYENVTPLHSIQSCNCDPIQHHIPISKQVPSLATHLLIGMSLPLNHHIASLNCPSTPYGGIRVGIKLTLFAQTFSVMPCLPSQFACRHVHFK